MLVPKVNLEISSPEKNRKFLAKIKADSQMDAFWKNLEITVNNNAIFPWYF